MTDQAVRRIITDEVTAAIAALNKQKCPRCGAVAVDAKKVANVTGVDDFWKRFYGNDPAPGVRPSPSGGLFE